MDNFRIKIIGRNVKKCRKNYLLLTDWEKGFITTMELLTSNQEKLSRKQFNILNEIANKYPE